MTTPQDTDPIFTAIAAHKNADNEAIRICSAPYGQGATKWEIKNYENGPMAAACQALWDATEEVSDTMPTTIAGCSALALFILDDQEDHKLSNRQIRAIRNLWQAPSLIGNQNAA